jgi:S-adenosylmethionine synthetase
MPIMYAHKLVRQLTQVRKTGILPYLRPDGKSQVTVEYRNGKPCRVDAIIVAAQHNPEVTEEQVRKDVIAKVIKRVIPGDMMDDKTKFFVNPTGRFVIGGPQGDTGVTGRKIIVDTYGGLGRHGGGCFSGKDPSKVDRSASYMCRYVAKNIVAAGLADKCEVQVAYAIGVAEPMSVVVNTYGTGKISDDDIVHLIRRFFDLTPKGMVDTLALRRPIYRRTAAYGHFGREEEGFTWEICNMVDALKRSSKKRR